MSKVVEKVTALALPVAEAQGVNIWDVEYVKEAGQWFLRIYIDREGGIDIDACEAFSRAMDPILDQEDPIESSYVFEVSSAGLERELKKPEHFAAFLGSPVEVKFYRPVGGSKSSVGTLVSYSDGNVTVSVGGNETTYSKADVASVRLRLE